MLATQKEITKAYGEAAEKFFHVSNLLKSGIPEFTPAQQRQMLGDIAMGLGLLAQTLQLQSSRSE